VETHAGISRQAEKTTGENSRAETAAAATTNTVSAATRIMDSNERRDQPAEDQVDGLAAVSPGASCQCRICRRPSIRFG
jgi:hypothetical protein